MVICVGRGADLRMVHLMPLSLTVCCFSKIQIGFTFLVPAHLGSPRQNPEGRKTVVVVVVVVVVVTYLSSLFLRGILFLNVPAPSSRLYQSRDICLEAKMEDYCVYSIPCCVVYDSCV